MEEIYYFIVVLTFTWERRQNAILIVKNDARSQKCTKCNWKLHGMQQRTKIITNFMIPKLLLN